MNKEISVDKKLKYQASINFSNFPELNKLKEKNFHKPIDLSNKIKIIIENLEDKSSPIVGDYYLKRKNKYNRNTNLSHKNYGSNYENYKRGLYYRKSLNANTLKDDVEKASKYFLTHDNIKKPFILKEKLNNYKISEKGNYPILDTDKNFNTESKVKIRHSHNRENYNVDVTTNRTLKNDLELIKTTNKTFSSDIHYGNNKLIKFKSHDLEITKPNEKKLPGVFKEEFNKNISYQNSHKFGKHLRKVMSDVTTYNQTTNYFNKPDIEDETTTKNQSNNFHKLPKLSETIISGFNQSSHTRYPSTVFQQDLSTQNSSFFKLTNMMDKNRVFPSKLRNLSENKTVLENFRESNYFLKSLPFDKTPKNFTSNFNKNLSINLKNKSHVSEFLKTCEKENQVSQYVLDVMSKYISRGTYDVPIQNRFTSEQIAEHNLFRLKNYAKMFFIFSEDKGLFISEDSGVTETLNLTKRVNRIKPGGSYKFRKIIANRIGLNILEEGNIIRLIRAKKPPDVKETKRTEKFFKQHEFIVDNLEKIQIKNRKLIKRKKNYSWENIN